VVIYDRKGGIGVFTGEKVSCFKDRFNDLFTESNKTNTDLGKELHVSNQTISAWRLGTRSPKLPTAIAIASYFHVTVQWLLGYDVKKEEDESLRKRIPIVVPDAQRFVKLLDYMPQDDYLMVLAAFEKADQRLKLAEGENE
jgi:DNA-binding XRE family transcriptional regulator